MSGEYDDDCYIDWTGTIFNNKYIMLKKLGKGSYSSVWLSYDFDENKFFAIKIFNRCDFNDGKREVEVYSELKKLKSKNLMMIQNSFDYKIEDEDEDEDDDDADTDGDGEEEELENDNIHVCIIMDVMACSSFDIIRDKGMDPKIVIQLTKQIIDGLIDLHKSNYIHGDIKPENILLGGVNEDNEKICKKILELRKNISKAPKKSRKKHKAPKTSAIQLLANETKKIFKKDICDNKAEKQPGAPTEAEKQPGAPTEAEKQPGAPTEDRIDEKIFKPLCVKITDIGSCIRPDESRIKPIQTRYYRCPEVLLKLPYDEKTDMWSLGCTIYELLTGEILFDPDDDNDIDREHLYLITKSLGSIPPHMIDMCKNKDIYFTKDKRIRGFKNIKYVSIIDKIMASIDIEDSADKKNETILLLDLMMKLLIVDPEKRLSSEEAAKHQVFTSH
jgi:serine/threonine-protein kinase SRPK3